MKELRKAIKAKVLGMAEGVVKTDNGDLLVKTVGTKFVTVYNLHRAKTEKYQLDDFADFVLGKDWKVEESKEDVKTSKEEKVSITKKANWNVNGKKLEFVVTIEAKKGGIVETYLDGHKGSYAKGFDKTEKATVTVDGKIALEGWVSFDNDDRAIIMTGDGGSRLDEIGSALVINAYNEAKRAFENKDWVKKELARQKEIALAELDYSNHVAKMNAMMRD